MVVTRSRGQRLRSSLARVLRGERAPFLLVLDEPTDHLVLDALEAHEGALTACGSAPLVVGHDAAFLKALGVERRVALGLLGHPHPAVRGAVFVAVCPRSKMVGLAQGVLEYTERYVQGGEKLG